MHQFDIPDKKNGDIADDATQELHRLAGELEHEELLSQSGVEQQDGDVGSMDNVEGWVDERDEMDVDDLMALDNDVQPIRFVLTKVSWLWNLMQDLIIKNTTAPQTCICNQKFQHPCSPGVTAKTFHEI